MSNGSLKRWFCNIVQSNLNPQREGFTVLMQQYVYRSVFVILIHCRFSLAHSFGCICSGLRFFLPNQNNRGEWDYVCAAHCIEQTTTLKTGSFKNTKTPVLCLAWKQCVEWFRFNFSMLWPLQVLFFSMIMGQQQEYQKNMLSKTCTKKTKISYCRRKRPFKV